MAGSLTSLATATGNASASTLVATGVTASIGDLLVASAGCFSATTLTFTDSASNTWTTRITGNQRTAIATCRVTTALSAGTVTVTIGAPSGAQTARTLIVASAAGLVTSAEYDQAAASAGGSTAAWNSGNLAALAQANELLVAASSCDTAAGTTSTPDSGWTEVADITNGGGFQLVMQYKSVASAASGQNGGGTWGSSGWAWNAAIIALKEAGAAAPTVLQPRRALMGVGY